MRLGIYLVTDRSLCGGRSVVDTVRAAVQGGAQAVQLRDKSASFEDQLREVERLAEVIDGRALLLVNDRLDVVVEARRRGIPVDGVHLGQGDAAVHLARAALGAGAVVGLTANTLEHLAAVGRLPAGTVDYLGIGVIHPTTTKPDHPPALEVEGFGALARSTSVPAVAIGGVGIRDIAPLRRAGAAGVALVSAICAADDPEDTTRRFVRAWDGPEADAPQLGDEPGREPGDAPHFPSSAPEARS